MIDKVNMRKLKQGERVEWASGLAGCSTFGSVFLCVADAEPVEITYCIRAIRVGEFVNVQRYYVGADGPLCECDGLGTIESYSSAYHAKFVCIEMKEPDRA